MLYFTSQPSLTSTASKVVDAESVDRVVQIENFSGTSNVRVGFSSTTAFRSAATPIQFVLPAGEELWAVSASTSVVSLMVTKSDSSLTFTCS